MNDRDYNQLRESGWRRKLTPAEEAELQSHLATNPAAREDWESDEALSALLERLPEAPPVSSNFTSLVLQKARQETAVREPESARGWFIWRGLSRWLPRAAMAALVFGLATLSYHQHLVINRAALAGNVVELTEAVSADPRIMEDIEPIRRLGNAQPKADTELLALMK